jgi:hypothetical protein
MDTPSNNPRPGPKKSWRSLTARAAQAMPPADLDVRHAVRAAITAGAAEEVPREPGRAPGVLEQIALLGQGIFARLALGACCAGAAAILWIGLDAATGLGALIDLQGLFMTTF